MPDPECTQLRAFANRPYPRSYSGVLSAFGMGLADVVRGLAGGWLLFGLAATCD